MTRRRFQQVVVSVLWLGVFLLLMAVMSGAMAGCSSAVQAINANATEIDDLSRSSEGRFERIANEVADDELRVESEHGIMEQQAIQGAVASIREELPRVEDRTPWWAMIVGRVAIAGALIAIIILLWQTGLGALVRRLVYSVSFLIPRRAQREAAMDWKIVNADDPATMRESIAAKRASDPAYNAAWKHAAKENAT